MSRLSSLEICAGAGGQALGLERAGFDHAALVELEPIACETLRTNRPEWNVLNRDVRSIDGSNFRGIDLLAGGVPCPPFSIASRQLGADDSRDLFPAAIDLAAAAHPIAVVLENVPGLAAPRFQDYRDLVRRRLSKLGYVVHWNLLNACDFGVPQLRPRFVLVALKKQAALNFMWPLNQTARVTVGEALYLQMASRGWLGADEWARKANRIAPTLVGGSKLHGGPDLGPSRAKRQWLELAVDGNGVADLPPDQSFPLNGLPKLTVRMAASLQGFPLDWQIAGRKTAAYRQIGNAFPPPVAQAIGVAVIRAIRATKSIAIDLGKEVVSVQDSSSLLADHESFRSST
jgi:DNA (cytosine-5)-methyltransferase 1